MSRILSLAIFAVTAALIAPPLAPAQDADSCQKCPNCQSIEFEMVGVDIPLKATEQSKTTCKDATSSLKEIAFEVKFNYDIPFLNIPVFTKVFRNAPQKECDIFVFDDNCTTSCGEGKACCAEGKTCCAEGKACCAEGKTCCAEGKTCCAEGKTCCAEGKACCAEGKTCCAEGKTCCAEGKTCCAEGKACCGESNACCAECKDDCICCEQREGACCGDKPTQVEVEVAYNGEHPFLPSIPCISPLFKNVGFTANEPDTCPDGECPAACAKTACPSPCCGHQACETSTCRADAHLQLVSHHEAAAAEIDSTRDDLMHQLMEMHVENARLQAKIEAMAHHMELMKEMSDQRAENAALRAQLNLMEKYQAETRK